MDSNDSVTQWITSLKRGDLEPAQRLWTRYVARLVRLARNRLGGARRRVADEEDVVVMAFEAFLAGVRAGRFSQLDDRDDVWQILAMLTERKAVDQLRVELAAKRGGGAIQGESAFAVNEDHAGKAGLGAILDVQPTPEFAAEAAERVQRRFDQLGDDQLVSVALAKLEGYTNAEIARQLGKSVSSIERKLSLIRALWNEAEGS